MELNGEVCKSLVKWLQICVPNRTRTVAEICDGVAMLDILMQISPQYFTKLEPKIKKDVGTNWRLRISNLKKILEAVIEYYQDELALQLLEIGRPDVNKIGELNDPIQLGKFIILILGCAINCDKKQDYITKIMEMEEQVQRNIMIAIQQLEEICPGRPGQSINNIFDNDPTRVARLMAELESAIEAKDRMTQECQNLEQQIQNLLEEKKHLLSHNQALIEKESRDSDARKKIENLKEELLKSEVVIDNLNSKLENQNKQLTAYQEKIAELQIAANDSSRLKDEVDALNESASKIVDLEQAVQSYQKRLENYQDIKRENQILEEKNREYLRKNLELEEEVNKHISWKSQCEAYKSQVAELQQKLDEELQKSEKVQFSYGSVKSKLEAMQGERERLIQERDLLKEENEELKLGNVKQEHNAAMSQELTPTEMRERLRFLEKEKQTYANLNQEIRTKQDQLDSANMRLEKLKEQNTSLTQDVMKLQQQLDEMKNQPGDAQGSSNSSIVKKLHEALAAKENELQVLQRKYDRSVEKAKSIIQQQNDPKPNGGIEASLRQSQMKELESKLITTAFYKLGLTCQREAIDERLAALSAGQGQSFLARQRQATPRKNIQRYKSK